MSPLSWLCIFVSLGAASAWSSKKELSLASFNVQIFGSKKMAKPEVVDNLIKIMRQYDYVFFQEIRDSDETAIFELLKKLNYRLRNKYKLFVSERLGRSDSKEQYGIFYREDELQLVDTWQYQGDEFERPPIVAELKPLKADVPSFLIIGCHIKPDDAEKEMEHLLDVHKAATKKFNVENVIFMGDFNAGCGYIRKRSWLSHPFRGHKDLDWLIGDDAKTTTSTGEGCPYDRFVVAGSELKSKVVKNSAKPFFFDEEYKLDNKLTRQISDHYPIEMRLA